MIFLSLKTFKTKVWNKYLEKIGHFLRCLPPDLFDYKRFWIRYEGADSVVEKTNSRILVKAIGS